LNLKSKLHDLKHIRCTLYNASLDLRGNQVCMRSPSSSMLSRVLWPACLPYNELGPTLGLCSPPIGFTHWKTKENNIINLNIHGSEAAFFLLAMYRQNSILKGKFVKIMCFSKLSVAKIKPIFKKNCQISLHGSSR